MPTQPPKNAARKDTQWYQRAIASVDASMAHDTALTYSLQLGDSHIYFRDSLLGTFMSPRDSDSWESTENTEENDLKILSAKWQSFGPRFNALRPNTHTLLRQRYSMQCIILFYLKFKIQLHIPPSRIMWVFPNNELEVWFSDIKVTIFEQVHISSIWLGDELVLVIFVSEKWKENSQWHKWHKNTKSERFEALVIFLLQAVCIPVITGGVRQEQCSPCVNTTRACNWIQGQGTFVTPVICPKMAPTIKISSPFSV